MAKGDGVTAVGVTCIVYHFLCLQCLVPRKSWDSVRLERKKCLLGSWLMVCLSQKCRKGSTKVASNLLEFVLYSGDCFKCSPQMRTYPFSFSFWWKIIQTCSQS